MKDFWLWFSTGVEHIADFAGYDHILFVMLLAIAYSFKEWKPLLWMVTAFTLGHSVSLALSVTTALSIPTELVEFLIALSILLTAVFRFFNKETKHINWMYLSVVLFGLIHGMGFSYLLKAMLDKEESVAFPLVCFNLGLEVGQLFIVLAVLILNFAILHVKAIPYNVYKMVVVSLIGVAALKMCAERVVVLI